MKKAAGFLLTIFAVLLLTPSVHAQQESQRWVCLNAVSCLKDTSCSEASKGNGHRARLSSKPGFEPLTGKPTYVIVCLATDNGQMCTTGNTDADNKVYGKANVTEMQNSLDFKFAGLFKGDGTTTVANPAEWAGPYEWADSVHPGRIHTWYAMNYWTPIDAATGQQGGQQQGTFDFEMAEKDCVKIGWDPYGRVFDAGTLEPVTGATVTLQLKKDGVFKTMTTGDLVGGNLINPQTTLVDGDFSFVVPDGEYKLSVAPVPLADTTALDPNYTKAYSDIYPALTGDVIVQQGGIQHRDIPVATRGTNTAPKMMEYIYQTTSGGLLVVEGRVSHPLTKLLVKTAKVEAANPTVKTPYRTVSTFTADKLGKFKIEVDQNKFEKTADYVEIFSEIEMVKTDLKQPTTKSAWEHFLGFMDRLVKPVQAAPSTASVKFEPIPRYLEGYAYDSAGKAIPNAKVGVYLTISNKAYSEVTADSKGFFKLTSEYLPVFSYELRYTTAAGTVVRVSPSVFLAENQKYLVEQKVNPYVGRDLNDKVAPTTSPKSPAGSTSSSLTNTTIPGGRGANNSVAVTAQKGNPTSYAGYIVILVVVLLILVGVAVWLIMSFRKAHSPEDQTLPPPQGVM